MRNYITCLGQTRAKLYHLFRTEKTKTIPCRAAHPRIGDIREYPPPPLPRGYSSKPTQRFDLHLTRKTTFDLLGQNWPLLRDSKCKGQRYVRYFVRQLTKFSFRRIRKWDGACGGLYLPSCDGTADTSVPASPPKIMKEAYGIRRPYLEKKQ